MQCSLHVDPNVLDWVEIGRVWRMVVEDNTVVFKEGHGCLCCMDLSTILHEEWL